MLFVDSDVRVAFGFGPASRFDRTHWLGTSDQFDGVANCLRYLGNQTRDSDPTGGRENPNG
jgi:hypothetical protein